MKDECFAFFLFVSTDLPAKTSCYLKVYPTVVHTGIIPSGSIVKKSNCPRKVKERVRSILINFDGRIKAAYLNEAFKKKLMGYRLKIIPSVLTVLKMDSFLQKRLGLPANWKWRNVEFIGGRKVLTLAYGEKLKVVCSNCENTGMKNISLSVFKGRKKANLLVERKSKSQDKGLICLRIIWE